MELGIKKLIENGNGNALLYTALISAALANVIPTPFDAIYFKRVNTLQKKFENNEISSKKLEYHVAGEYYLWTSLWYLTLFTGIYSFGGKYKTNAKILLGLVGAGLVIGTINKNIENNEIRKQIINK